LDNKVFVIVDYILGSLLSHYSHPIIPTDTILNYPEFSQVHYQDFKLLKIFRFLLFHKCHK